MNTRKRRSLLTSFASLPDNEVVSLFVAACQGKPHRKEALIAALLEDDDDDDESIDPRHAGRQRQRSRSAHRELASGQTAAPASSSQPPEEIGRAVATSSSQPTPQEIGSTVAAASSSQPPKPEIGSAGGDRVNVEVTLLSGTRVACFLAYTGDLVRTLKQEIVKIEGTHHGQQVLLHGNVELENKKMLGNYGPFQDNRADLNLLRRLHFIASSSFEDKPLGYVFKMGEHGLGFYKDMPPFIAAEHEDDLLEGYEFKHGYRGQGYYRKSYT